MGVQCKLVRHKDAGGVLELPDLVEGKYEGVFEFTGGPRGVYRFTEQWVSLEKELKEYHDHKITVVAEIGAGSAPQPLGRGRPHLNDKDEMIGGKEAGVDAR